MANVKISELPTGVATSGSMIPATNAAGTVTEKVTVGAIAALAASSVIDSAPATLDTLNELAQALNDDPSFATTVTNAIAGKADAVHTHAISDVSSLQTSLDGKAAAVHGHAIADVTGLQSALDGKAASSHAHAIADVTGLQTALDGKAASSHSHAIADVTGLQSALDGKADSVHGHAIADVTNLQTELDAKVANGGNVSSIQRLTQAQYDAIPAPDANTLYVIVG